MASPLLDKFREQNPDLAGTSDDALANYLHQTYYSDIPFSKFAQTVGVTDPNEAGALRSYGLIPVLKGITDVGGAVGYGLEATGIAPEFGKEVQQSAQETAQRLTERQSLAAQEDARRRLITPEGTLGDYNLGTFIQQAGESLPGMLTMGVPGGILAKGATTAARALGAGAAAKTIGSGLGFGAAEGIFSGATNAAQVQQTIRNTSFDKLVDNPAFIDAYHNDTDLTADQNTRLEQARDLMARKAGNEVFGRTAISTGAIGALTGGGLYGQLRQGTTGGILARGAKGFAKEAGQEAPQSAGEQYIQNIAEQKYLDTRIDPYRDVLTSGIEGGIVGGALGLGGVFSPSREQQETDLKIAELAKAPSVDEAIVKANELMSVPVARTVLEPSKIIAEATVPGLPIQQAIEARYQPSGYIPGEAGQVWEAPNIADVERQAQINRAFYQQEQAQFAEKEQQLREMENNPQISKQQQREYRKARIALRVEQNRRADEFRSGLGFNVVPYQAGEVRNTQLQEQLRALQSGRPTEPIRRDAERYTDITTPGRDLAGGRAGTLPTAPAEQPAATGVAPTAAPTAPAEQPTEITSNAPIAPPTAQPIVQPQQGEILPETGGAGVEQGAVAPAIPSPRAYQFRGYSTGIEPTITPPSTAAAPGIAPTEVKGPLKIGDVVQAKPGTDAIGGTITAIREFGKKQFIETDQSGGRRFETSKFVVPTQQIGGPEGDLKAKSPETLRQSLAEVRQKIKGYEAFLTCLRG